MKTVWNMTVCFFFPSFYQRKKSVTNVSLMSCWFARYINCTQTFLHHSQLIEVKIVQGESLLSQLSTTFNRTLLIYDANGQSLSTVQLPSITLWDVWKSFDRISRRLLVTTLCFELSSISKLPYEYAWCFTVPAFWCYATKPWSSTTSQ
jgi:hypothetical protein